MALIKFASRIPEDIKAWLAKEAERDACSQNSVIVRILRARMEREQQRGGGA
jgi:predicted HicB family RNase H-like nuclease